MRVREKQETQKEGQEKIIEMEIERYREIEADIGREAGETESGR